MSDSLKETAAKSMFWAVGERFLTQGTLFVISLVLARILSPEDYGVLSLLLIFINLADVLVTNGLGEALIQKNKPGKVDYGTIFVTGLAMSVVLYALFFLCSDVIAAFYGMDQIGSYLRVLALRLPFSTLSAIQKAYIAKAFLFRTQFVASSLGSLLSGVCAIAMALYGFGIYSLIAQQLLSVVLTSLIMALQTKWLPQFTFCKLSFKTLVPLGVQFCGASLINSIYTEGRSLIIGKFYSAADLAYFNRGNQFPSMVIGNLNAPISNVMLPVMCKVNGDKDRLRSVLQKAIRLSSYLVFPMMAILAGCAPALVTVLLTDKWSACVPYLQLGCLFFLFQPLQTMNWQALKAMGEGACCLRLEVVKKVICFGLLFASIPFGVMGIAIASAASGFFSMIVNIVPVRRLLDYGIKDQIWDIAKPALVSSACFLAMLLIGRADLAPIALLMVQLMSGLLIYILGSMVFKLDGFAVIRSELLSRKAGKNAE